MHFLIRREYELERLSILEEKNKDLTFQPVLITARPEAGLLEEVQSPVFERLANTENSIHTIIIHL